MSFGDVPQRKTAAAATDSLLEYPCPRCKRTYKPPSGHVSHMRTHSKWDVQLCHRHRNRWTATFTAMALPSTNTKTTKCVTLTSDFNTKVSRRVLIALGSCSSYPRLTKLNDIWVHVPEPVFYYKSGTQRALGLLQLTASFQVESTSCSCNCMSTGICLAYWTRLCVPEGPVSPNW